MQTQSAFIKIWTRVTGSIAYVDNHNDYNVSSTC